MKVYFAASSSGSHQKNRKNYSTILQIIKSLKHTIMNPYYAAIVKGLENHDVDRGVKESDDVSEMLRKKIIDSDCVVAEISVPSISLGIQIEYALSGKIPVLCLFRKGNNGDLPLMIRDYKDSLLFKQSYTQESLGEILKKFFKEAPKTRIKFNMFFTYELERYLSYLSKKNKIPKSEVVRLLLKDKLKEDKEYSLWVSI